MQRTLSGKVLVLRNACVLDGLVGIVDDRHRLKMRDVKGLMDEPKRAIGQRAEAEVEIFVDRARIDNVLVEDVVAHIAKAGRSQTVRSR